VDWSGRRDGTEREAIWCAEVLEGALVRLTNGRSRSELMAAIIDTARNDDRLVLGLDFAFGFPAWWARELDFVDIAHVWRTMLNAGEHLLSEPKPPFWGAAGSSPPADDRRYRATDQRLLDEGLQPKSVFQLDGPGAVGRGSIRGMPFLVELHDVGFSIWPFHQPGWPRVVEIWPRVFTGPLDKGRFSARHQFLQAHFADQDPILLERAAGSADAFDAAVSALCMADPAELLEGRIWRPGAE
jgi:hypothetical protein